MKPWQNNLIGAVIVLAAIGVLSLTIVKTEGVEKKAQPIENRQQE